VDREHERWACHHDGLTKAMVGHEGDGIIVTWGIKKVYKTPNTVPRCKLAHRLQQVPGRQLGFCGQQGQVGLGTYMPVYR
jgi:hypothetical protein